MGATMSAAWADSPVASRLIACLYLSCTLGLRGLSTVPALQDIAIRTEHRFVSNLTLASRGQLSGVFLSALYRPVYSIGELVNAIVEIYMASRSLPEREKELGSSRFLLWAALSSICSNVTFLSVMKLLDQRGLATSSRLCCNQGLWPIVMVAQTLTCISLPSVQMDVLGFTQVPSKWYPLSLAVGLSFLNGAVQWETLSAVAFAYVYGLLKLEDRLLPGRSAVDRFERFWLRSFCNAMARVLGGHWVPALRGQRPWPPRSSERSTESDGTERGQSFRIFSGTGHRLGG
eukprot:TRINITY_DN43516_c0_g1_i2.p1 TRINITY_DN43516_c0_g1~~TRINITY_DN43516_c0_g1_i2.p1  ORF type:complete len:289 (+),score=19.12 TRINITY_DN43516_c0_g1_i2:62-928(+)